MTNRQENKPVRAQDLSHLETLVPWSRAGYPFTLNPPLINRSYTGSGSSSSRRTRDRASTQKHHPSRGWLHEWQLGRAG